MPQKNTDLATAKKQHKPVMKKQKQHLNEKLSIFDREEDTTYTKPINSMLVKLFIVKGNRL